MTTNTDTNNDVAVSGNQNNEFTQEDILRVVKTVLGENPPITPEEALGDPELVSMVITLLRKERETKRASAFTEAKRKLESMLKGTMVAQPIFEDESKRIERVLQYQQDTFNIVSPKFVFQDVELAASWRRYLINFIIGFRNLMKTVDQTTPDGMLLASKAAFLQMHIDAADAVLEGFFKVSADYRTKEDLRKQVEMKVFMNSEYDQYQKLVQEMATIIDSFRAKYSNGAGNNAGTEEDQGVRQHKHHGKKGKKHAQPRD